jgi:hypothetical protein
MRNLHIVIQRGRVHLIPTNSMVQGLHFSLTLSCLLTNNHSHRFEVIAHCGFTLYLSDELWCETRSPFVCLLLRMSTSFAQTLSELFIY